MKQRYVRVGDDLSDDVTVVVRGGELDPVLLRDDALRNHSIYGTYGISVFALRDVTLDEFAQLPPLVRFEQLTLMTVGALRMAGLRLDPTGRNPRHSIRTVRRDGGGHERIDRLDRRSER